MMKTEVMDYIKCCDCGFVGLVEPGEEYCPSCKKRGFLSWANENMQEVFNDFELPKGKKQENEDYLP